MASRFNFLNCSLVRHLFKKGVHDISEDSMEITKAVDWKSAAKENFKVFR